MDASRPRKLLQKYPVTLHPLNNGPPRPPKPPKPTLMVNMHLDRPLMVNMQLDRIGNVCMHSCFYAHTVKEYDVRSGTQISGMRLPQQQNSSHGGNYHNGSIETKQRPTAPISIIQMTKNVLLIVAHIVSLSLNIEGTCSTFISFSTKKVLQVPDLFTAPSMLPCR
jgi:hypothetical protein